MAALTEEQVLIRDQAKSWVSEQAPVRKFREMRDAGGETGYASATWEGMIDLGWTGILVPEQYGGSALGFLTFGLVLEETGRQLTASPLLASALVGASAVLVAGSDAQKQALLPGIVGGKTIVSLAVDERPRHAPAGTSLSATRHGDRYRLSGRKVHVPEGMAATDFVVVARTSGAAGNECGITLLWVPAGTPGVSRQPIATMDSRGYAEITFDDASVAADHVLGDVDAGSVPLASILDRARAGVAAEMLGTASQAFDMTLEYLKTRVQFGQVIGSFQALGHRAADLFTRMELARSCVEAALQAIDAESDDVARLVALSKCRAGEFLHSMSNELIQVHGGIGMTDEFDAGFYLKRARVLEATYGNQAFHRDRYATLLDF